MKPLTSAETAILTLLAEEPLHGYAIEQRIEERGMREWTEIGFSSIYYVLKKLEGDGLISGTGAAVPGGGRGPGRKVFALAPAGRKALKEAALTLLGQPQRGNAPLLLGLANLPGLPPDEARAALAGYAANLAAQAARLRAALDQQRHPGPPGSGPESITSAASSLPPAVEAMFDYSITLIQAEQGWIERFLEQFPSGGDDVQTND